MHNIAPDADIQSRGNPLAAVMGREPSVMPRLSHLGWNAIDDRVSRRRDSQRTVRSAAARAGASLRAQGRAEATRMAGKLAGSR